MGGGEGALGLADKTPSDLRDLKMPCGRISTLSVSTCGCNSTYFWTAKPQIRSNLLPFFSEFKYLETEMERWLINERKRTDSEEDKATHERIDSRNDTSRNCSKFS